MRTLRAALVCFALGALLLAGKSAASSLLPEPALCQLGVHYNWG